MITFQIKVNESIHDKIQHQMLPSARKYRIVVVATVGGQSDILFESKRGTQIPKQYFGNVYNTTKKPRYLIIQKTMKDSGIEEATVRIMPM